ncbi:MAG: HAMP domain-containing histidine kinase [Epsilonproteobacteria bacterium]|nr:hypothetical protein [Campylobacterota bacterium]NPA57592.1 HAMP domain-containing histidine kinase [Campylobacterota bacterium]
MKRISIFFWITFIFFLASIGIGASYLLALKYMKTSSQVRIQKRYDFISQSLIWQLSSRRDMDQLAAELERIDMFPITYPKEVIEVVKHAQVLRRKIHPLGEVILLKYKGDYYIWVQSLGNTLLIKDMSPDIAYNRLLYTAIFGVMMGLLFLVYLLVIVKLRPLKKITREIEKFSQGSLDLDLSIESSKEINEVAQALQNAAQSLKAIQSSRKLLLRNIMHELKTPITKGRILAEMVEDPKQRQRLVQIFEKLNSLINEFAALEAVNSKIRPNLKELRVSEIVEEAINVGIFDKQDIEVVIREDPTIEADYKLMSIAIKNIIDNGLKYAHRLPIRVEIDGEKIAIKNFGEPLKKELRYYTEPFTKDHPQSGFGLGLYLVANILKLHGYTLRYTHEKGVTSFEILLKPVASR